MTTDINELYNRHIRNHLVEHHRNSALPYHTLQLRAPDLSCQECYPPPRTSDRIFARTPFGRFWHWYSGTYSADTYTSQTTGNFGHLTTTRDPTTIRTCVRDIIFSCRYQTELDNPREIALAILQRFTHRTTLPPLDFEDYTTFDPYLDADTENYHPQYPDLGSSIVEGSSDTFNTVPLLTLPEERPSTPLGFNLLPFSEDNSVISSQTPSFQRTSLPASPTVLAPH